MKGFYCHMDHHQRCFTSTEFTKDLEDREVYVNIQWLGFHKVVCRYLVLPCVDVIKWILQGLDTKSMALNNFSGQQLASYQPHEIHLIHNLPKPEEHLDSRLYVSWSYLNAKEVNKSWWKKLMKFCQNPNSTYKTKSRIIVYHYLMVMCCRVYGQRSIESFPKGWIYMLYLIITEGKIFNWSNLLSQQLQINLNKVKNSPNGKKPQFYMYAYLLDGICARHDFHGLKWNWTPRNLLFHVYFKLLT